MFSRHLVKWHICNRNFGNNLTYHILNSINIVNINTYIRLRVYNKTHSNTIQGVDVSHFYDLICSRITFFLGDKNYYTILVMCVDKKKEKISFEKY